MADKDLEKRLAALEKSARAAESRAKAAEAKAAALERSTKELKAQHRDQLVEHRAQIHKLNAMRDLAGPESPYANDSRDTYAALKKATVKTKDGRRHYYAETACYVADNGKPPYVHYPAGSIVSIPGDQDPSVTWKPVKVGGKDPKNGALVFIPLETVVESRPVDPAQQVEEGEVDETPSNTELNDKAAKGKAKAGQRGAGAPPAPTPPMRPGANEPETEQLPEGETAEAESTEPRAADTEVG